MSRGFGLVALLVSLAVVAALMAMNMSQNGPTSEHVQRVEAEAKAAVGSMNFTQAAVQLQAFQMENGTYVGASLPASFGVALVRADATGYCLQAGSGAAVQHMSGPGGAPAAGPC
jgi:hypothetical protein